VKPEAEIQTRIDHLGGALAEALGEAALCITVYGSAAGEDFSPGLSDVNLLIVLREVTYADLRLIGAILARDGKGLPLAAPLVVGPDFLERARDSFPIELADIRERHRILAGTDVLSIGIRVAPERLREQAEREARTLLLKLRAMVMRDPSDGEVRQTLSSLASTLAVIERALLRAKNAEGAALRGADLFRAIEQQHGIRLPTLTRVLRMREGGAAWPTGEELNDLLPGTLHEVEALVSFIDGHGA
jgi:hypothetical protein